MTLCCKAVAFMECTAGNARAFLLTKADSLFNSTTGVRIPPIAKCLWYGERHWRRTDFNFENRIKENFKAGDNSVKLRQSVAELLRTKYENHQRRYTDGSLSSQGVGMGVSDEALAASMSLPKQCSVFSAEAAAIHLAASTPANRPIVIITDSASCISALQSERPRHPWIQRTIKHAPPGLTFLWVPGHCGVPGNDTADLLAGTGPSGARYSRTVPSPDAKHWIRAALNQAWRSEWAQSRGAYLRKIKGSVDPWTDLKSMRDQKIISRLRTGHTRMSHDFGGALFHRTCEVCSGNNSVEHIICVCPKFEGLRRQFGIPTSIRDALGDDSSALSALLNFVKGAGMYHNI